MVGFKVQPKTKRNVCAINCIYGPKLLEDDVPPGYSVVMETSSAGDGNALR